MSFSDSIDDEREEGELCFVVKKEWVELQDHTGEMVLSCEELVEVER